MLSLTDLAGRCRHIGLELCERDLTLYELVDRATALTVLARALEELLGREHPVAASGTDADQAQQDIDAGRTALHDAVTAAEAGLQEELRDRLLSAQRRLFAACRLVMD